MIEHTPQFMIEHDRAHHYAIRTLPPEVSEEYALPLVRMQWLFVILVYIAQLRKKVRPELLDGVELRGRGWEDVVQKAQGKRSGSGGEMEDVHYLKGMFSFPLFTIITVLSRGGANSVEVWMTIGF